MEADKLILKKRNAMLKDFVGHVSLLQRHNLSPIIGSREKKTRVELLSIHKSKGLEFDSVWMVGVEEGLLPHHRALGEDLHGIDEERRLFYVGITRAQETLRISHCRGRRRYNQVMPCQPSAFLQELPTECVEDMEVAAARKVEKEAGGDWFKAMREALK
jgi:superfamily I DNA/RNA helicase